MEEEQKEKKSSKPIGTYKTFGGKRQSGKEEETQSGITEKPQDTSTLSEKYGIIEKEDNGKTVKRENVITAKTENIKTEDDEREKATEKVTLYLFPSQLNKLDDLILAYRKRTGKRITYNKLLRLLIDHTSLDDLL